MASVQQCGALPSGKQKDRACAPNVDRSLSLHEDWLNNWTKAQLVGGKGKTQEACQLAQKAKTMGEKNPDGFFFADEVKKKQSPTGSAANWVFKQFTSFGGEVPRSFPRRGRLASALGSQ